jgi:hypothetical protein
VESSINTLTKSYIVKILDKTSINNITTNTTIILLPYLLNPNPLVYYYTSLLILAFTILAYNYFIIVITYILIPTLFGPSSLTNPYP